MERKFVMLLQNAKVQYSIKYDANQTIDTILTDYYNGRPMGFPNPHGKCLLICGKLAWGNMTLGTELQTHIHLTDKPEHIPRNKIYDSESVINEIKGNPSTTLVIDGCVFERFYYDPTQTIEQLFTRLKKNGHSTDTNDSLAIDGKYAWGNIPLASVIKKNGTVSVTKRPENILPNQIFKPENPPSTTTTSNPYTSPVLLFKPENPPSTTTTSNPYTNPVLQPAQSAAEELPEALSPETKLLVEFLNLSLGKINSTNAEAVFSRLNLRAMQGYENLKYAEGAVNGNTFKKS